MTRLIGFNPTLFGGLGMSPGAFRSEYAEASAAPVQRWRVSFFELDSPGNWWLYVALFVFLLQVLPFLSRQWVTDESWYAAPGYSLLHGNGMKDPAIGPNDIENHFYVRPPGTSLVIAAFYKLLGTGQTPARLGSVIGGCLIVFLVYWTARDLISKEAAVVASLFSATDNFIVLASRTARPEALTTLGLVAALFAMSRYRSGKLRYAALSGLCMAFGSMFHATLVGYILSLAVVAVLIDRQHGFWLRGATVYALSFFAGLTPFAVWVFHAPLGPQAFRGEYFGRVRKEPLLSRLLAEKARYLDMFGYNRLHGHGLESLPIRLPIPLLLLVASYLLWKYRRRWFYLELLLLIPTLLWFVDSFNKSSRYIANLAPVFALVMGCAVVATRAKRTLHKRFLVASSLVIFAQFGANLVVLRAAGKANYTALAAKLRGVVPEGETVYGTITFWLAFHDHPYISYERTDPWMARNDFHARYFIAGDRMMTMGSVSDEGFYRTLNQHFKEAVAGSTVVGHVPDPYYGDLFIYRVGP